ncbi:hypothetical protein [Sulfuritalea hydrogenivorans]|uniref:Uncharacterized protein n=1 Tax=Sulfuritalea hydrogenivorans sk43H TaxID=1223802 RepID=W0SC70_9PROT|nr:hypothetical protein [Sulfuritalea hydrogenivorans]BAO28335.1 hypothetical protein SUTH_00521 [Sulfuritalea hydrogenivorans sk43H]
MPAVTDAPHETFPEDGSLYRIFWGGELLVQKPGHLTERVRIWLKEVDEHGRYLLSSPIVQVTESVGAIPRLPFGSFWRNGRKARPKLSNPTRIESLSIIAPAQWQVVRAGDSIPVAPNYGSAPHTWINRSDLRLIFDTATGRKVRGLDARVVSMRTISGQEVIIPSYEIFRAFFAGTTDLAHALINSTWGAAEKSFIVESNQRNDADGAHWHIDLAAGVPHSALPYLSWMHFDVAARKAADRIYAASVNQAGTAWLSAMPPIVGEAFRIRAHVVPLRSRNALLVTQVCGIDFPVKIASLSYSISRREIPSGAPIEGGIKPPIIEAAKSRPSKISTPTDRNPTRRYFQLPSMSVKFSGLPIPKRSAREDRYVPISVNRVSTEPPMPQRVSVGVPGTRPAPSAAQFTPEEERNIEDRFQAIMDLVEELIGEGRIDDVREYPLVRPIPADAPNYCEFPFSDDTKPWPWSMVREPLRRPRLALVLELAVRERLIYWIETETVKDEGYHSLAIEMVNGGSLDEGTLETLLDVCADAKGVWPDPMSFGTGTILSARARHTKVNDKLTWNVMLLAFARLERERATLSEGKALGNHSEFLTDSPGQ